MTIAWFLRRIQATSLTDIAGNVAERNASALVDLNKHQLNKGINRFGGYLSPKYSEDPWFKSAESAKRYADWKKRLYPEMTYDVPNLIITGYYHGGIAMKRMGSRLNFSNDVSFAASVEAKYKGSQLGLSPASKKTAWGIIRPAFVRELAKQIGVKTK